MVRTRKSTGKLPPPKFTVNVESDEDVPMSDSEEEEIKRPAAKKQKRTKKQEESDEEEKAKSEEVADVKGTLKVRLNRFQRCVVTQGSKAEIQAFYAKTQQTKEKQKKRSVNKRDAGKLAPLLDAPMDIFCEVASYLQPLDLLRLARTTRSIRNMLMSKHARGIWKTSRDALGMPNCPDDISEAEYISLIFEKECKVCGGTNVQNVHYAMRWRLCKACARMNVIKGTTIAKEEFGKSVMKNKEIYTLLPNQHNGSDCALQYFFKPDFVDVVSKYLSFGSDKEARDKFVLNQQEKKKRILESVKEIQNYLNEQILKKKVEYNQTAEKRKADVEAKLKELGYSDDEINNTGFWDVDSQEWNSFLYQKRELTPQIWKMIRPKMEKIIERRKERAIQAELDSRYGLRKNEIRQFYIDFVSTLGRESYLVPPVRNVYEVPEVKALIERDEGKTAFTEEDWETVLPLLQDGLLKDYRDQAQKDCLFSLNLAKLDMGEDISSDNDSSLWRADAFFQCEFCKGDERKLIIYPNIAGHPHIAGFSESKNWRCQYLICDRSIISLARRLLICLNLPIRTTMEEMELKGRIFMCLCCDPVVRKKRNWRELVEHFVFEQSWYKDALLRKSAIGTLPDNIVIVDDHAADARKDLIEQVGPEEPDAAIVIPEEGCLWRCDHCAQYLYYRWMTRIETEAHVRMKHNDHELKGAAHVSSLTS